MREVHISEVEAHLPRLLDDVQRGETIAITRNGHAVAHLVPATARDHARAGQALEGIRALRQEAKPMTAADILSARDEGRR
jgi:prevent-host-death family protein